MVGEQVKYFVYVYPGCLTYKGKVYEMDLREEKLCMEKAIEYIF